MSRQYFVALACLGLAALASPSHGLTIYLPLGCGIPTEHEKPIDPPHKEDSNNDGIPDQCHGKSGDGGECVIEAPDTEALVYCIESPRDPESGTCHASMRCGSGSARCTSNSNAWSGKRIIDGVSKTFIQCEKDGANPVFVSCAY